MPVLIVDDYRSMLRIVRGLLTQLGFSNVDEAMDGQSAYDMLCAKPYGLVISDWNMQPVTGLRSSEEGACDACDDEIALRHDHR